VAAPPPPPAVAAPADGAVQEHLQRVVAAALYLDPAAIDPATSFADLGLDSILAVELTREINTVFGTTLQAARLYDYGSIAALAAHLTAGAPAPVAQPVPPIPTDDTILPRLRALLAVALFMDVDAIDPHAEFANLGLDSILAVEFTKSINDAFNTSLNAARLYDHPDLVSLAHFIAGMTEPAPDAVASPVLTTLVERVSAAIGHPVSATTPLAEIGLEPAQAMALLDALNAEFGFTLSAEQVGRCRDLAAVAALAPEPDGVVPMGSAGTGSGRASFWVHGATGDVGWVSKLAIHLDPAHASYGLEAPGLHGTGQPLSSIEALAAHHAAAIARTHPAGPVTIGGYSAGGPIAFEIARILLQQGRTVERLVLIDAPSPGNPAVPAMQATYGEGQIYLVAANWMARNWGAGPLTAAMLAGRSKTEMLDRALAHLEPFMPFGTSRTEIQARLERLDAVGWGVAAALRDYWPAGLPKPVDTLLVACTQGMRGRENPFGLPESAAVEGYRDGWQALLRGPLRRLDLDCDHFRAVAEPFAQQIAAALAEPQALAAE
jgi:thioesterase domain-containing protein/acyl carrier protein